MSVNPPISEDDIIVKLCKCPHVFHRYCIATWLETQINHDRTINGTCPTCRHLLVENPSPAAPSISDRFGSLNSAVVDSLPAAIRLRETIAARLGESGLTTEETQALRDREAQVARALEWLEDLRRLCAEDERSRRAEEANVQ